MTRKTRLIITNKFTWLVLNSKHSVASGFLLVTFCVFFFIYFCFYCIFVCFFLLIFFIIFLLGSCRTYKNCMVQNMCSPHFYFSPQCLIFTLQMKCCCGTRSDGPSCIRLPAPHGDMMAALFDGQFEPGKNIRCKLIWRNLSHSRNWKENLVKSIS